MQWLTVGVSCIFNGVLVADTFSYYSSHRQQFVYHRYGIRMSVHRREQSAWYVTVVFRWGWGEKDCSLYVVSLLFTCRGCAHSYFRLSFEQ